MRLACIILALLLACSIAAHADELHLKDGTKVVGTIVGYQGNSFRVKTSYGYALVERSSVVSITVTNPPPGSEPAKKSEHEVDEKNPVSTPKSSPPDSESARKQPKDTGNQNAAAAKSAADSHASSQTADGGKASVVPVNPQPAGANAQTSAASAAPAQAPVAPPSPPPIREEVLNNLYVNDTYGFRIYKPPEWNLLDGARAALPGAIAALGTSDQTTYLIIGLESTGDTLQAHVETTNGRLADSFDDFRPGPMRNASVAGLQACEYQFVGVAEKQTWSGTVALIRRGENIFTIFGVTTANSDLVQIQQNVISRVIASLQFTNPQSK